LLHNNRYSTPTIKEAPMAKTVAGLFESFAQAQSAVGDLVEAGIERTRIGVVAPQTISAGDSSKGEDKERKAATLAAGAGAGAIGGLGLAMALAPVAIPGVGLIIAAGALVAGLTGAGIAASLPKVLRKLGVPEEPGHAYAEGVRRGGTLVTVEGLKDAEVERAVAIMKKHGAVDIQQRAGEWRRGGWSGRVQESLGRAEAEPMAPIVRSEVLFVFSAEEIDAYPGEERRSSRQPYSGAERRKAA
jgi:hypothetical protein